MLIHATWMCAAVAAPQSAPRIEPSLLTSQMIVTAIGSDADAEQAIKLVLGNMFGQRFTFRNYVLASQVREAWLPRTRLEIGRPAEADVQRHLATCGDYWVLFDVIRKDSVVSMKIRSRCGCSVSLYVATFENGEWHLRLEGAGGGCGGPPPGCPCPFR
jgi:hypothetical protein